jgi:hypothetical protein
MVALGTLKPSPVQTNIEIPIAAGTTLPEQRNSHAVQSLQAV